MRNIHDLNEYHKYKNITTGTDNRYSLSHSSDYKPTGLGWFVTIVVVHMFIFFISSGADVESITTLLGFGLIAYLFAQWISK